MGGIIRMRSPNRIAALAIIIATVLLCCVPAAAKATASPEPSPTLAPNAPPVGLHPSTANLATVLASWGSARGTTKSKLTTEVQIRNVAAYGLTGVTRFVVAGDDYRETDTLGPVSTQLGSFHGQRWRINENGILINQIGVHKRDDIDSQVLRSASLAPTRDVTLAGEVDAPAAAYVLKVDPPDGRLKWLMIDKKTSLLDSEIDAYPERRLTITYDDYRSVDGVMRAWHESVSDGHQTNDVDSRVTADSINVPVAAADIKIPEGGAPILTFPPDVTSVRLPARLSDGTVVVRLTIDGRGLDFALDSGAGGIVLDSQVAKELGIKTFGKSIQNTAGEYEATQAVVPEIDVGPISMHNTYVECLPFSQDLDFGTKIVGLLGFDFIANAIVSIDYDKGTVTASPPDTFTPPTSGIELGATLDDGVPFVQAQVDNAVGDHFILDTGATDVIIFSEFADAHPDDVADEGLGRSINAMLPFISASGVGGEIPETFTQVASYTFGTANFKDFLLFRTHGHTAFEGEDEDGLVGYAALRYFTVTLDYRNGTIYLKPGPFLKPLKATPAPSPHP
jgi:predicted aspartyl protease